MASLVIKYVCRWCRMSVPLDEYCLKCDTCDFCCQCGWADLKKAIIQRDTVPEMDIVFVPCMKCDECFRDDEFCPTCSLCLSCCDCRK